MVMYGSTPTPPPPAGKNAGEARYNTTHRRTRCVIDRCFGLLKRRFPCTSLGTAHRLGEYPGHYCGYCSVA